MPRGGGRGFRSLAPLSREVQLSKSLSRLLRHAAVEENIPIDDHGYVRLDHVLGWNRIRGMQPRVSAADVVGVVGGNDKQRFSLKYIGDGESGKSDGGVHESETQRATNVFESTKPENLDVKRFFIRATQGHSMKGVEAANLLTRITLDQPESMPEVVVHGTFYGAWDGILKTGGLKSMSRNHVHFACGPRLEEIIGVEEAQRIRNGQISSTTTERPQDDNDGNGEKSITNLLGANKVISGMRSDAQILIYIDIHRALKEQPEMKWWRSENEVILSDGITGFEDGEKIVPKEYFLATIEIKEGVGVLYEAGRGVIAELPDRLRARGVPRGKGGGLRGGRGRGRG
jgi:2'-phosphotransferase